MSEAKSGLKTPLTKAPGLNASACTLACVALWPATRLPTCYALGQAWACMFLQRSHPVRGVL